MQVPALNDRREDIPLLIDYFMEKAIEEQGFTPKEISQKAVELLKQHNWTGNIRELRNVVERLLILGDKEIKESDVKKYVALN